MILTILKYPDKRLRRVSRPVAKIDDETRKLVRDMAETMYDAPGVGLAAPQVGVDLRIAIVDVAGREDGNARDLQVFINPEILAAEGEQVGEEGCLSVRDYSAPVKRAMRIRVRAQNLEGETVEFEAEEFFARVLQHEFDHLDGKLFIDRISPLRRAMYRKKLKKILAREKGNG
jgi:peptide deformylase